jgi:hypothetical protein
MTRTTEHDARIALEQRARAARDQGCGSEFLRDHDDLAGARPLVWLWLAWCALIAFFVLALVVYPTPSHGALRGVATVGAWHNHSTTRCETRGLTVPASDRPGAPLVTVGSVEQRPLNRWTPGLGVGVDLTEDSMASAGLWRNSQGNVVPFGLIDWRPLHAGPLSVGVFGGLTLGYCGFNDNGPAPMGGATARLDLDRVAIHLLLTKAPGGDGTVAVGLAVSIRE